MVKEKRKKGLGLGYSGHRDDVAFTDLGIGSYDCSLSRKIKYTYAHTFTGMYRNTKYLHDVEFLVKTHQRRHYSSKSISGNISDCKSNRFRKSSTTIYNLKKKN